MYEINEIVLVSSLFVYLCFVLFCLFLCVCMFLKCFLSGFGDLLFLFKEI